MSALMRSRRLRSLRALWRSFQGVVDSEAARAFWRALQPHLETAETVAGWTLVAVGLGYFVVRAIVSLRWGV